MYNALYCLSSICHWLSLCLLHSHWFVFFGGVSSAGPNTTAEQHGFQDFQDSVHSLFLFPMHIPLWDVMLKRHTAWENGAAEVLHRESWMFRHLLLSTLPPADPRSATGDPRSSPNSIPTLLGHSTLYGNWRKPAICETMFVYII